MTKIADNIHKYSQEFGEDENQSQIDTDAPTQLFGSDHDQDSVDPNALTQAGMCNICNLWSCFCVK